MGLNNKTTSHQTLETIQQERKEEFSKIYKDLFGKEPFTDEKEDPPKNQKEGIALNIYGIKAKV